MSQALVDTHIDGAVARLTLNDPDRANVLSMAMMDALEAARLAADADPEVRIIVLEARGKVFCAGHDLGELRADEDSGRLRALFDRCGRLMLTLGGGRVPVLAVVRGAAVAAGCQLVAACDLALAADRARFAVSGVNLGLFCSTPGVALGRAVGRKAALDMLLTGRFIDAARAEAMGLINRAVPAAELDAAVDETVKAIIAKAPETIALGRRVFAEQMAQPLAAAYGLAAAAMVENLGFDAARDGIDGFLGREKGA